MFGGLAIYMLAHVAARLRMGGGFGRGRPIAAVVLVVLLPLAMRVPAIASLALVAAVCAALIAYEYARHRAERAFIRTRRADFTLEEVQEVARSRRRATGG